MDRYHALRKLRRYAYWYRANLEDCLQEYHLAIVQGVMITNYLLQKIAQNCAMAERAPYRIPPHRIRTGKLPLRHEFREDLVYVNSNEEDDIDSILKKCHMVGKVLKNMDARYPKYAKLLRCYYGIGVPPISRDKLIAEFGNGKKSNFGVLLSRARSRFEAIWNEIYGPLWRKSRD